MTSKEESAAMSDRDYNEYSYYLGYYVLPLAYNVHNITYAYAKSR